MPKEEISDKTVELSRGLILLYNERQQAQAAYDRTRSQIDTLKIQLQVQAAALDEFDLRLKPVKRELKRELDANI